MLIRANHNWTIFSTFALCCVDRALLFLPATPAYALGKNYVAPQFRSYYYQHQGMRGVGYSQTGLVEEHGYLVQYLEKGRLEDHRCEVKDPSWAVMFGRHSAERLVVSHGGLGLMQVIAPPARWTVAWRSRDGHGRHGPMHQTLERSERRRGWATARSRRR